MISLAPGTKICLASKPVSSTAPVRPYCGHVFLFRSRSGNYLKALHWDGSGMCLFAKRLERHRSVWPPLVEGRCGAAPGTVRAADRGHGLAAHHRAGSAPYPGADVGIK